MPNLPPGTLPPVVLPFDPTSTTPVCLVALDSKTQSRVDPLRRRPVRGPEHDHGDHGAVAPVVYGGKIRAVMVYLDREKMQARGLSPLDVMKAVDNYNVFLPTGDAKFGDDRLRHRLQLDVRPGRGDGRHPAADRAGNAAYLRDVATPKDASFIQTNVVRVNGRRQVYIPVFRQLGASTLEVVDTLQGADRRHDGAADARRAST